MYDHEKCAKCKYSERLNDSNLCCMYICINGHMRGCYTGDECEKFEHKKRRRKAIMKAEGFRYEE